MQRTDYDRIAEEYKRSKFQPWRKHVECYTLFRLIGDVTGLAVLDLACGEGFYTRRLAERGASRVVGVDRSGGMIELARAEEARAPLGIEYLVADVEGLNPPGGFDLVVAAYLLNYADSRAASSEMCQAIGRCVKPGGRFVTVNNNPDEPPEHYPSGQQYGFLKGGPGGSVTGTPITWTFFLEDGSFELTNYYLDRASVEADLLASGLRDIRWHPPEVSPDGLEEFGAAFWAPFLDFPPVIFLEATREST